MIKVTGNVDVVVFDENNFSLEFRHAADLVNFLDEFFARLIGGMGFAGKDQLDRSLSVVDDAGKAIEVAEDECGSFVGGKSPCKADGENFRVKKSFGGTNGCRRLVVAQTLLAHFLPNEFYEVVFEPLVNLPNFFVGNFLDCFPRFGLSDAIFPDVAGTGFDKSAHGVGDPGGGVDTVCDVADGDFVNRDVGPDTAPHVAGDAAMDFAHSVGVTRQSQGEDGHTEGCVGINAPGAAEFQKFLKVYVERFDEGVKVFMHEIHGKSIVAGRHRGVCGENIAGGNRLKRFMEFEPFAVVEFADSFKRKECGMAFVEMVGGGLKTEGFEKTNAANTKDDFLLHTHFVVATVELKCDFTVGLAVFGDICCQEVNFGQADMGEPGVDVNFPSGQFHSYFDRFAILVADFCDW